MTVEKCLGHVKAKHFVEKPRQENDELQSLMLLEHEFESHTCGVWARVCIDGCTLSITGKYANCTDTDTEQLIICIAFI